MLYLLESKAMAKLLNGILGGISGKIGSIVGATWRSVEYIRSLPKETDKPRTEQQLAQQAKFKFLHEFLSPFARFFTVGFRNIATHRTEMNVAFSINYQSALMGSHPNFEISYPHFVMSKGNLPNLCEPKVVLLSGAELELSWRNLREPLATPDDQVTLLLYNAELKKAEGFIGGISRSAGSCRFAIHPNSVGRSLEVYVSVCSINRELVSDSLYLGRLNT